MGENRIIIGRVVEIEVVDAGRAISALGVEQVEIPSQYDVDDLRRDLKHVYTGIHRG